MEEKALTKGKKGAGIGAANVLIRIFYCFLLLFPFLMAVIYGCKSLFGGWEDIWEDHTYIHYLLLSEYNKPVQGILILASVVALFLLCYFAGKKLLTKCKHPRLAMGIYVFVIATIVRIPLVYFYRYSAKPFGDFYNAWMLAQGDMTSLYHYKLFPAYLNYAVYLKVISHFFNHSFAWVLIFNIPVTAMIGAVLVGLTGTILDGFGVDEAARGAGAPLFAGLLYALYPSGVIYALTPTPEHQCILGILLAVWMIIWGVRRIWKRETKISTYLVLFLAGVCAAIGTAMKSFFPIVLVAMVIYLIFGFWNYARESRVSGKKALLVLLGIAVMLTGEKVTSFAIEKVTGHVFDIQVNYADAMPHFVLVGLNRQGEGQIHLGEISRLYTIKREAGMSPEEAKELAISTWKADWEGHLDEIPSFLLRKTIWAWQDDYAPLRHLMAFDMNFSATTMTGVDLYNWLLIDVPTAAQMAYILFMLCGLFSVVLIFIKKQDTGAAATAFLFNNVIIFGYFCLVLLSEAQSRYKCLAMPFMMVCIAISFCGKNRKKQD